MGFIDINAVSFTLPDGRQLLDEVTFRVADGAVTAQRYAPSDYGLVGFVAMNSATLGEALIAFFQAGFNIY